MRFATTSDKPFKVDGISISTKVGEALVDKVSGGLRIPLQ